ncbi:MAG: carbamate kinase [Lachnospiraceae bacterium]|jgi:carbamate kinase|nr:carbamate kinase [Lachnospiraceae bacterium]
MAKKRIVIALGHNDLGTNLPEQKAAVARTAKVIGDFIQEGWQAAIVHSNAPQVGMIHTAMNEFGKQHDGYSKAPMSVCSAMSQGYIGYDLQNGIRSELVRRGIYKPVCTVLTQVTVDTYDEAFYMPVKKIGRYMTAQEAAEEEQKGNYVIEEAGKGFRRIVASPKPVAIVEIDAIKALLDADQMVIACGGGGIPVMEQGCDLKGASAIIEKDLASGLLAKEVDADVLMIITKVDNVTLNYGTPNQQPIYAMSVEEAREFAGRGHFEFASMLPKVNASIDFVENGKGRKAIITSLKMARESIKGKGGTVISQKLL